MRGSLQRYSGTYQLADGILCRLGNGHVMLTKFTVKDRSIDGSADPISVTSGAPACLRALACMLQSAWSNRHTGSVALEL